MLSEVFFKRLSIAINKCTFICQNHKIELIFFFYVMWLDASNTRTVKWTSQVMQHRITVEEVKIITTVQIAGGNRGCGLPERGEQILAELGKFIFLLKRSLVYYFFHVLICWLFPLPNYYFIKWNCLGITIAFFQNFFIKTAFSWLQLQAFISL